jgi:hypothetical protein
MISGRIVMRNRFSAPISRRLHHPGQLRIREPNATTPPPGRLTEARSALGHGELVGMPKTLAIVRRGVS